MFVLTPECWARRLGYTQIMRAICILRSLSANAIVSSRARDGCLHLTAVNAVVQERGRS